MIYQDHPDRSHRLDRDQAGTARRGGVGFFLFDIQAGSPCRKAEAAGARGDIEREWWAQSRRDAPSGLSRFEGRMPEHLREYKAFVARFEEWGGLRHFSPQELLVGTDKAENTFPPAKLWPALFAVGLVWDAIRERLGHPCVLTSGYRNESYNRGVGGAKRSQHMEGRALDGYCTRRRPERVAAAARALRGVPFAIPARTDLETQGRAPMDRSGLQWRRVQGCTAFTFAGGVGEYENFVHVDIRGYNCGW